MWRTLSSELQPVAAGAGIRPLLRPFRQTGSYGITLDVSGPARTADNGRFVKSGRRGRSGGERRNCKIGNNMTTNAEQRVSVRHEPKWTVGEGFGALVLASLAALVVGAIWDSAKVGTTVGLAVLCWIPVQVRTSHHRTVIMNQFDEVIRLLSPNPA
jgi:hypothetical protein